MGLICFFQDEQIDLLKKLRLFAIIVWCLCLFCCFVICLNSKKSVYRKFPRFVIWKKSSLAQSIYFLAILKMVMLRKHITWMYFRDIEWAYCLLYPKSLTSGLVLWLKVKVLIYFATITATAQLYFNIICRMVIAFRLLTHSVHV